MGKSLRAHRRRIARQRHRDHQRLNPGTGTQPARRAANRRAANRAPAPGPRTARGAGAGKARPSKTRTRRRRVAVIAGAAFLILAAAGTQLAIPPFLTGQIRAKLQQIATVRSLSISYAFPAVDALWGHLDSVQVHLGDVDAQQLADDPGGGAKSSLSSMAGRVANASVQADEITLQQPVAQNLNLQKTGPHLRLSVVLDPAAIAPVLASSLGLPAGTSVQLTAAQSDPVLLISSPQLGGTIRLRLLAGNGTVEGQLQPTPALASRLGLPAGTSLPPQPLTHSKSLTVSQLTATWHDGHLRLTADGQLAT
jgi:hypothetical protein